MWIFDFRDYKRFLNAFISSLPKNGRGQSAALANHLNVQQSVISSVLNHDRQLTPEQGLAAATFFGFDEITSEYFVLLIQLQRSDTKELKSFWQKRLDEIREKQTKLSAIKHDEAKEISDSDKGIYYSNWYYSAARIALFIPKYRNIDALADFLNLSREKTAKIIDFFVKTQIVKYENGVLTPQSIGTAVNDKSEFLNNHRRNWRDKAREHFSTPRPSDYFLSVPMSMSKEDAEWFRGELRKLMDTLIEKLQTSPNEVIRCLNLDWFEF